MVQREVEVGQLKVAAEVEAVQQEVAAAVVRLKVEMVQLKVVAVVDQVDSQMTCFSGALKLTLSFIYTM